MQLLYLSEGEDLLRLDEGDPIILVSDQQRLNRVVRPSIARLEQLPFLVLSGVHLDEAVFDLVQLKGHLLFLVAELLHRQPIGKRELRTVWDVEGIPWEYQGDRSWNDKFEM